MLRANIAAKVAILALPAALVGAALAAQDRYTLQVPGGLAFSEFRGYEDWQIIAASHNGDKIATILGNPAMIEAYKAGIPGNGKPFPDGAKMAKIHWNAKKAEDEPGEPLVRLQAGTQGLLTAERTMLNLVCHLSGIATATARWVDAVDGTKAQIRDTRKTLPGMRALQKYAVRVGGGVNHRMGLGDAALIKDNHVAAAGSVLAALRAVRAMAPDLPCEVEVDSLEQLDDVLGEDLDDHGALVLLDNFAVWQTQIAVQRRDARAPWVKLESSGGLSLDTAAAYAATGVDYLAVGALTHSVQVLDVGLDI